METGKKTIKHALALASSLSYEEEHSRQVSKVALMLFDELRELHSLGEREKLLLEVGSLLHDIGWVEGKTSHHKKARDIILKSKILGLSREEHVKVALIARYHRKALPRKDHGYYSKLSKESKNIVRILASFVRLADGLDRTHLSLVQDIKCRIQVKKIVLHIRKNGYSEIDEFTGKKKADLFEDVFGRELEIRWDHSQPASHFSA